MPFFSFLRCPYLSKSFLITIKDQSPEVTKSNEKIPKVTGKEDKINESSRNSTNFETNKTKFKTKKSFKLIIDTFIR